MHFKLPLDFWSKGTASKTKVSKKIEPAKLQATLEINEVCVVLHAPAEPEYGMKEQTNIIKWTEGSGSRLDDRVNLLLSHEYEGRANISITFITHPESTRKITDLKRNCRISCTGSFIPSQRGAQNNFLNINNIYHEEHSAFYIQCEPDKSPQLIAMNPSASTRQGVRTA